MMHLVEQLSADQVARAPDEQDRGKNDGNCMKIEPQVDNDDGLPWVEKYRPHTLVDVVSHDSIIETRK